MYANIFLIQINPVFYLKSNSEIELVKISLMYCIKALIFFVLIYSMPFLIFQIHPAAILKFNLKK